MAKEIERKFLVESDAFREEAYKKEVVLQGFLSSVPERTVRVRKVDNMGWITVKGIGNASGTTRFEWEKEIPGPEARDLLDLCESGKIEKTRHYVKSGEHTFEVDEFRKHRLLNGLDDIGLTLQHADEIKAYESRRKQQAPWLFR